MTQKRKTMPKLDKTDKLTVVDELNGIQFIFKLHSSKDVAIFWIDLKTILKGCDPCWHSSFNGNGEEQYSRLTWLDPHWKAQKNKNKKIKSAYIDFGKNYLDYSVSHSLSKYSCVVTFYKKKLLSNAIENPPLYRDED